MGTVVFRPATAKDVVEFSASLPPYRVRAFVGEIDGVALGVGGLAYLPDGSVLAFCDLKDEARRYPVALHRAGLATLRFAAELGIKKILATADNMQPAAERWLLRLGFAPVEIDGLKVFINVRS